MARHRLPALREIGVNWEGALSQDREGFVGDQEDTILRRVSRIAHQGAKRNGRANEDTKERDRGCAVWGDRNRPKLLKWQL